ncbi:MAG TPA: MCE family protein [Marmoricola sp.]
MTRLLRLLIGVIAVGLVVSGCSFHGAYDLPLPGKVVGSGDGYKVSADFADVVSVVPRTLVMANDVPVGQVDSVERVGWHARVVMTIRKDIVLPANATADVRQTSLLGEKYIQLAAPAGATVAADGQLKDGAEIPLSRTTRNPEVEEILGALSLMLSGGGVQQLKTITTELNKMMDGRQKDVRDVLGRIDALVGSLDTQKTDIVNAMSAINDLTATLNKERKGIGAALDSFGPALKVLNQQHSALMTMLRSLDKLGKVGGRVIRESKDNVITTLKHLAPILRRLANAGNSLPKGLMMMASYPFPKEAATLAKGDYSNALFYMNFDLNKILKGVVKGGNTGLPDVKDLCGIYAGDPATCAPIFTTLCNLLPNNIVCGNGPGTEPTADAAEKAELKKESAKGSGDLSDTVTNLLDGVLGGSTSGQGSGSAGSSGSSGGLSGLLGLLGGGR